MVLLDTNACIQLINGTSEALNVRLRSHSPSEIRMSAVVKAELYYGARKSRHAAKNLELLRRFFEPFVSLPFDDRCAQHYGAIRSHLEAGGRPIGPNDLMIAATALANDLLLVTHNTREFTRVAGLAVEDWQAG
jgi:tRNA(fMet)-specific endonuclease VapC